jgi:hypothetical protein
MAWRKTATFHAPIEVLVLTCDVCACDIGHEDERRPRAHFQLSRHPNPGAIDDQEPAVVICSRECLRAFVANVSGPDRAPPMPPPSVVGQKRTARTQILRSVAGWLVSQWPARLCVDLWQSAASVCGSLST